MTVASIPRYLYNLRYVSPIFGISYLLAGVGAWQIMALLTRHWTGASLRWVRVLALAVLLTGASLDYLNFRRIFVDDDVPDLASRLLLEHSIYAGIAPKP